MAVKVITLDGEGEVKLPDGQKKTVKYKYSKIVTPGTKRNAGTAEEQKDASYPKLSEIAQFLGGNVEFKFVEKEINGVKTTVIDENQPTCAVQYIIDGWNLEANRKAKDDAANTPAVVRAKARMQIKEMKTTLAKAGMPTTELDNMLKQLDEQDAAEAKAQDEADKKEAAAERASRSPKSSK